MKQELRRRVPQPDLFLQVTVALIAGVDEAGRGPLAGPVFAAAVILDRKRPIAGLADSKVLSAARREVLAIEIRARATAYAIASATAAEIDTHNILAATFLAMQRAVQALAIAPAEIWIDGNRAPAMPFPARTIVQGDASVAAIAAASILAKTARDAVMIALDARHPCYGFAQHKGYPTKAHLAALIQHGPIADHRTSFAPVRAALMCRPDHLAIARGA